MAYEIDIRIYFDLTLNVDGFDYDKKKFFVKKIVNSIKNNRIYVYDNIESDLLLINAYRNTNTLPNNNVNLFENDPYLNEFRDLLCNNN